MLHVFHLTWGLAHSCREISWWCLSLEHQARHERCSRRASRLYKSLVLGIVFWCQIWYRDRCCECWRWSCFAHWPRQQEVYIYPTCLRDPKFEACNDPMSVVSPDIGIFVYREKSANLPYYPDDALRLETMHNNVPMIPSHSACFLCKAGGELLTCSFCLLSSHRDCIDTMAFVFPDTLHVMLPRRIGSNSMCKCCAKIKFKNYS